MYDVVRFLHVLLGAIWMGGAMYGEALVSVARKEGKEAYARANVRVQVTSGRIYPVIVPLVAVTAIYLIIDGGWDWGALWISISFLIWIIGLVVGIAYFAPKAKSYEARLGDEGASDGLLADLRKTHMVQRVDLILLAVLLAMMIFQPGT
ncbi:MAG: hypothetical protein HKN46_10620 [Acidimicrobiia bacterium]|nr:hypothetical protein [Acidimicrobiia bacterium]